MIRTTDCIRDNEDREIGPGETGPKADVEEPEHSTTGKIMCLEMHLRNPYKWSRGSREGMASTLSIAPDLGCWIRFRNSVYR